MEVGKEVFAAGPTSTGRVHSHIGSQIFGRSWHSNWLTTGDRPAAEDVVVGIRQLAHQTSRSPSSIWVSVLVYRSK